MEKIKEFTQFEAWNNNLIGNFGSFQTTLFKAYQLASQGNRDILNTAYPDWFVTTTSFQTY